LAGTPPQTLLGRLFYSTLSRPLAGFKVPTSKGREGREGGGRQREEERRGGHG